MIQTERPSAEEAQSAWVGLKCALVWEGRSFKTRKEQEWLREEEVGMWMETSRVSHWDSSLLWSEVSQRIQTSKPYAWRVTCKLWAGKKHSKRRQKPASDQKNQHSKCFLFYCSDARQAGNLIIATIAQFPSRLQTADGFIFVEMRQDVVSFLWSPIPLKETLRLCVEPDVIMFMVAWKVLWITPRVMHAWQNLWKIPQSNEAYLHRVIYASLDWACDAASCVCVWLNAGEISCKEKWKPLPCCRGEFLTTSVGFSSNIFFQANISNIWFKWIWRLLATTVA